MGTAFRARFGLNGSAGGGHFGLDESVFGGGFGPCRAVGAAFVACMPVSICTTPAAPAKFCDFGCDIDVGNQGVPVAQDLRNQRTIPWSHGCVKQPWATCWADLNYPAEGGLMFVEHMV
jgi:hypothetical protein